MMPSLFHGGSRVCHNSRVSLAMIDGVKRLPLVEGGEEMMPRLMPSLLSLIEEGEGFSMELTVGQMCGLAWTATRGVLFTLVKIRARTRNPVNGGGGVGGVGGVDGNSVDGVDW